MLDIKFIRDNPDLIREAARKKHLAFEIESLIKADERRLALLAAVEAMRAEQNQASKAVVTAYSQEEKLMTVNKLRALKANLHAKETELQEAMVEWRRLMLLVPNLPDVSVPEGESEADNREVRREGKVPDFDFPPRGHLMLMERGGLADFERGTKAAGFRGYFLKNEGLLLSLALWQFSLSRLAAKGFTPLGAPALVRRELLLGTGYLPQGEEDLYRTQDELYLAGTGEVGGMGYFANEVLDLKDLPKKFAVFSPCFRREAGSHGKDVKGLIRVHEFFKVEQLILTEASHETSVCLHEELTENAEEILRALELSYRVVALCGGDLGLPHVKTYDLETWFPADKKYRETHSSSYYHDFQCRRLGIRYRDGAGKLHFAHSLNNTGLATPRLLAAIIENYQEADGRIRVPKVLVPYLGRERIGGGYGEEGKNQ